MARVGDVAVDEVIMEGGAGMAKHTVRVNVLSAREFVGEVDPVAVTQQMARMFVVSSS